MSENIYLKGQIGSFCGLVYWRLDSCAEVLIIVHVYILKWRECVFYTLRSS